MQIGDMLLKLVETKRAEPHRIHIIGMDMGSHIATLAAHYFTKFTNNYNLQNTEARINPRIRRVTGLSPLGMHFQGMRQIMEHSSYTIDNIHTNTPTLME